MPVSVSQIYTILTNYYQSAMSLKIALGFAILLAFVHSLCLDPNQPQDKCTSCVPVNILIDGTCFVKIRGCLTHAVGPICTQCQFGYVLANKTCIRQAVFNNNTNPTPPPVVIITQTLTFDQIQGKLGPVNITYFMEAHQYFLARYTEELGTGNVSNVHILETKTGLFIIITYEGVNKIKYQAVAYASLQGQVREWSFTEISGASSNAKRDPLTGDKAIRVALGDQIKDSVLYQFNQERDTYTYDYLNSKNEIKRVTLYKYNIRQESVDANNLTVEILGLSDLALERIAQDYPAYQNYRISGVQKIDQYYIINLNLGVSVSFKFSYYVFTINRPLQFPSGAYISQDSGFKGIYMNGFNSFNNFSDPRFMACAQYIAKQFTEVAGGSITKVQSQSNIAFLISLKKNTDQYDFLVWFNASKLAIIIEGKKNGKLIYQDYYNYNTDSTFLSNYKIIQNTSRIINVPAIQAVTFKQTGTRKYYKVVYSAVESAEFQYLSDVNKANLLSYFIDGENLLDIINFGRSTSERKSLDALMSFLRAEQQLLVSRSLISELAYNIPTYTLTIVTASGTYKAFIDDRNGQLSLTQFAKISDNTCFELSTQEVKTNQKVKSMNDYVKNNYPLDGYSLQQVQVNVYPSTFNWRILYSNQNLKQIVAYFSQKSPSSIGNPTITKIQCANNAYQVLNPDEMNPDYHIIVSEMQKLQLNGNKVPFFTEQNGTAIVGYYDDGKSTYQVHYDKEQDSTELQVIATRPYLLVPEGFSIENLLIPGTPNVADAAMLSKIKDEVLRKYTIIVRDATIAFADKKANVYNLMYKGIYGYQKLQANVSSSGAITVGRLTITVYKDKDFSNCQKYDSTGKCLSCDANTEVQYEGGCHKKLQGCLIQPGAICAKCDANYIKMAMKCVKNCSSFFAKPA